MPEVSQAELDAIGYSSVLEGGRLFCGVSSEDFAIEGRTYGWSKGVKLTWSLGFSRLGQLDDMTLKQAYKECFAEISGCCDVTHEYTPNPRSANILVNIASLDGRGGTLADMQIPVGNVSPDRTQLLGRIDDGEVWGLFENPPRDKIDFYRVALHELLHAHGLGHKPSNVQASALISPMYSTSIRHLQAADKAELVRRYGPSKSTTPTNPSNPTTPGIPAGWKEQTITILVKA